MDRGRDVEIKTEGERVRDNLCRGVSTLRSRTPGLGIEGIGEVCQGPLRQLPPEERGQHGGPAQHHSLTTKQD